MASDLSEIQYLKWTAFIYISGLPWHGSQWSTSSNILTICLSCIIVFKKNEENYIGSTPREEGASIYCARCLTHDSGTVTPSSNPTFFYSTVFPVLSKLKLSWIKYIFRGTGLSHDVKCSHSVHMREPQGYIQPAKNNLAAVSLQCNLHFQSHQNTWLKVVFWKLDLIRSSHKS